MNAVLGGTFDPIHSGHIHLIEELLAHYDFSKLFVIPAGQNPHKKDAPAASGMDRVEMVRAALLPSDRIEVLDWEVTAPPPSYTVHTLERLIKQGLGPLTLVMGDEVHAAFDRWHRPDRILELAKLLVIAREPKPNTSHRVEGFSFEPLPYSATLLREAVSKLWKTNDLTHCPEGLPERVWELIKKKKLYTESSS